MDSRDEDVFAAETATPGGSASSVSWMVGQGATTTSNVDKARKVDNDKKPAAPINSAPGGAQAGPDKNGTESGAKKGVLAGAAEPRNTSRA